MSNVLKKIIGLKAEQLDDLVNDRLVIDGETKTYDEINSLYVVNVNEETGEVDLSGFATEDWVKSAHQTIDSITSQDDGFDILYSTGAEMTLPIKAEDGIVVDVAETGDYIVVHLEDTFLSNLNKAARALVTPVTTPTEFELVGISTANSQERVKLGDGLSYEAGVLKATGGGGANIYLTQMSFVGSSYGAPLRIYIYSTKDFNEIINYVFSQYDNDKDYIVGFFETLSIAANMSAVMSINAFDQSSSSLGYMGVPINRVTSDKIILCNDAEYSLLKEIELIQNLQCTKL